MLTLLLILCAFGFTLRDSKIRQENAMKEILFDGRWVYSPFDARCRYTPADASDLLGKMGKDGRQIYMLTQLTLDLLFPFVYGGLIIILLFALYGNPGYLLLIPILTILMDLLENVTTAYLAWSYREGVESHFAWLAAAFTTGKSAGLYLSGILILVGVAVFIRNRYN